MEYKKVLRSCNFVAAAPGSTTPTQRRGPTAFASSGSSAVHRDGDSPASPPWDDGTVSTGGDSPSVPPSENNPSVPPSENSPTDSPSDETHADPDCGKSQIRIVSRAVALIHFITNHEVF